MTKNRPDYEALGRCFGKLSSMPEEQRQEVLTLVAALLRKQEIVLMVTLTKRGIYRHTSFRGN